MIALHAAGVSVVVAADNSVVKVADVCAVNVVVGTIIILIVVILTAVGDSSFDKILTQYYLFIFL